jgi:hypothetical protein
MKTLPTSRRTWLKHAGTVLGGLLLAMPSLGCPWRDQPVDPPTKGSTDGEKKQEPLVLVYEED